MSALLPLCLGASLRAGGVGVRACVVRVDVIAPYEADAPLSGDASEGDLGKARRVWEVATWGFSTRMEGRWAGEQSYSIWMDEADDA